MLKQIECDCFKIDNKPRGPITFHEGLNTILGGDYAENSIGKSTLLYVIDFCFGGESYCKQRFPEALKDQTIKFCFEFKVGCFYFARSLRFPNDVYKCDSCYNRLEKINLNDFKSFLLESYSLPINGLSFREVLGRFIRIFGLDTCNVKKPLQRTAKEKMDAVKLFLEKIFGKYEQVKIYKDEFDCKKNKKDVYTKAMALNVIPNNIQNAKQKIANDKKIEELKNKITEAFQKIDVEITERELRKSQEACSEKIILKHLYLEKRKLINRLRNIEMEMNNDFKFDNGEYSDLLEFFPNLNTNRILGIDKYHQKLSSILDEDIKNDLYLTQQNLDLTNKNIEKHEKELKKLNIPLNISLEFLQNFSNLYNEIHLLEAQNDSYEEKLRIGKELKVSQVNLRKVEEQILVNIEDLINSKLEVLHDKITRTKNDLPRLRLPYGKSHCFESGDDEGAGTAFKNMILFDICMLKLTELPVVIQDSNLFKNISDEVLQSIFELYVTELATMTNKQVFIAFDKEIAFNKSIQDILHDSMVISLGKNGKELFGYSWA